MGSKLFTYWQKMIGQAPAFFLMAIVATLPFNIQLNSLFIIFFTISVITQNHWQQRWRALQSRKWWLLLFSSLWLIHVISAFYSTNIKEALLLVERNLAMLVFPLAIFSYSSLSKHFLNRLLTVFILSCLLACLYCWSYNIYDIIHKDISLHYFFKWRYSYKNLANAINIPSNYFSFYLVFGLTALWYIKDEWDIRFRNTAILLISIVFVVFLLHLSARTSLLALFVVIIIHTARLVIGKKWKPVLFMSLFMLLAVVATLQFPLLNKRIKSLFPANGYENSSVGAIQRERINRWQALWPIFYQNPVLGVGSGDDHQLIMKQYNKHGLTTAYDQGYNAHNQFLQYAVTNGILGASCFLSTLIIPFALSVRKKKWLYVYFVLIFGICSITESTMRRNKGIVFYGLFSSVFSSFMLSKPSQENENKGDIMHL